jgi:hypothetical protein
MPRSSGKGKNTSDTPINEGKLPRSERSTIVEVKHNRFVVYTESGKVVIQTSDLRVARTFLDD